MTDAGTTIAGRPAAATRQAGGPDEATLLAGLRQGEAWAFDALVWHHGGRLLAVARSICRNEEDARDAVQSAYLSAFRALDRFEGESLLSTWLHRIVVNAALMRVRARKRKAEESIDAARPDGEGRLTTERLRLAATGPSADQLVARRERREAVHACIRQLPDAYRTVLLLRDIEEVPTPEAARRLNVTPTTVKVRLHRARRALTTRLRQHFGDLEDAATA